MKEFLMDKEKFLLICKEISATNEEHESFSKEMRKTIKAQELYNRLCLLGIAVCFSLIIGKKRKK
jgi:hypothetical protein